MKHGTTLFLKLAVIMVGLPVLAGFCFGLYWLISNPVSPVYAHILYPIVVIILLSVIPFFVALFWTFKLLGYIDAGQAFTQLSVQALQKIKLCSFAFSTAYFINMPFVYILAEKDDAPGLILMGMVPLFAALVMSVFTAVLKRLLQEAIAIKSENDLTV